MANKSINPKMEWRLAEIMGRRKITTATELQRRLHDVGVQITSSQLARLINSDPLRISTELLWGLTLVLECGVEELLVNPDQAKQNSARKVTKPELAKNGNGPRSRSIPMSENPEQVTGPSVSSYPKPNK